MGHVQRDCPDIWRRFHLTLEGETPVRTASDKHPADLWCCNCGRRGHLSEDCRRFAYSPYPRNSLRVVSYTAPREPLKNDQPDVLVPVSKRAAEKALVKAEKRMLKRAQFRTCPNSPQVPAKKRARSEANSPPAGTSHASDFIR
jgi:protein AIR1/2